MKAKIIIGCANFNISEVYLQPGTMCSPDKQRTPTLPSMMYLYVDMKHHTSDQTIVFHCWSSSDAHVPIEGAFSSGQGRAKASWLVCSYATS